VDIVVDRPFVEARFARVPARCADGVPVERDTATSPDARRCDKFHTSVVALFQTKVGQREPVRRRPPFGATIMT
jgi:hypothetical protein